MIGYREIMLSTCVQIMTSLPVVPTEISQTFCLIDVVFTHLLDANAHGHSPTLTTKNWFWIEIRITHIAQTVLSRRVHGLVGVDTISL